MTPTSQDVYSHSTELDQQLTFEFDELYLLTLPMYVKE